MAWLVAVLSVVAVTATALTVRSVAEPPGPAAPAAQEFTVEVPRDPGSPHRERLDATVYWPAVSPAPAVLLAHGFGGSKHTVAVEATELARRGYVVLTWSARGFGASTGQIRLNSPHHEVADARVLVDWLAGQPEVLLDAAGDPRVGVIGASYGGALALLLAGTDPRIDAIAPMITWNDLAQAFFPNAASRAHPPDGSTAAATEPAAAGGVFKRDWAGLFFSMGAGTGTGTGTGDTGQEPGQAGLCGRFHAEICAAYVTAASTGVASPEMLTLLRRSSPSSVAHQITAPTLLVQGTQDTLFRLDQADATARQLASVDTPVKVVWYAGGHDGAAPTDWVWDRVEQWFDHHLARRGPDPGTGFDYQVRSLFTSRTLTGRTVRTGTYTGSPGTAAAVREHRLALTGEPTSVLRPPGASPATLTHLPGLGPAVSDAAAAVGPGAGVGVDPPGQAATFVTAPLAGPTDPAGSEIAGSDIAGSPQLRLRIAAPVDDPPGTPADGPAEGPAEGPAASVPDEAVLFVKLYDIFPTGRRILPGAAVAPARIGPLPADGAPVEVTVTLPGIVHPLRADNQLAVVVATTDRGYALPTDPARYVISLADDAALTIPVVPGGQAGTPPPLLPLAGLGGLALLVVLGAVGVAVLRRRRADDADPALSGVPLVVTGLSKSYPDGIIAVTDVSFRVERGQVLGLLGPNGAGKTTVLRMLMGLIRPSAGDVHVFGHRVRPGAPVLSRIGSLVEGAGLLPQLSGADNLRLYWAATGRPAADADVAEVLALADLGAAAHRRVSTYSQGMRQRLAVAQAMLGRPDLLVLDEPTNGLDPPQIHAMRRMLREYAAGGRTVVVSSHLLAEVEHVCSHVVVMRRGRLLAAGPVADLVDGAGTISVTVDDAARAAAVLATQDTVQVLGYRQDTLHLRADGLPNPALVAALVTAGIGVVAVTPGRPRLEEAFLQLVGAEEETG